MKTQVTINEAARLIVEKLLGSEGLGDSTWFDQHPDAYKELLLYKKDMEINVLEVLRGKTIFEG